MAKQTARVDDANEKCNRGSSGKTTIESERSTTSESVPANVLQYFRILLEWDQRLYIENADREAA
jgi:hypothetical protein